MFLQPWWGSLLQRSTKRHDLVMVGDLQKDRQPEEEGGEHQERDPLPTADSGDFFCCLNTLPLDRNIETFYTLINR
jgi:hypothetical protein